MKYILTLTTILLLYSCTKESTSRTIDNENILGVYDKGDGQITIVNANGKYLKMEWDINVGTVRNNRTFDSVVLNSDNSFTVNEIALSKWFEPIKAIGKGTFSGNVLDYKINIGGNIIFNGIKRP